MANRRRRESGVDRAPDSYGRELAPGLVTDRKIRKMRHGALHYRHLIKNGVYDPFTFFHVVDQLLNIKTDQAFTGREFAEYLNKNVEHMVWDSTTVGRILNDLHDNFRDVHPDEESQPLIVYRDWSACFYELRSTPRSRVALWRLAEDLVVLCEELADQEKRGVAPKRLGSPMSSCPSVMDEAAVMEAA